MRKSACVTLGVLAIVGFFGGACSPTPGSGPGFDILIVNGRILDGTGNPWFAGDVGIVGDRIAAVGRLAGRPARTVIEAKGMTVSPGFIDMHTHCDSGFSHEKTRANANYVSQGVTTVVAGNCG
jgi:N-acyl-D-amino-acid deacylase